MSRRAARRPRGEQGYVAITMAVVVSVLFLPLAALSVDVAQWYVSMARLQNVADAAALAGVTYLPDDLSAATSAAQDVLARNGMPVGPDLGMSVTMGRNASQLRVTVSERVHNTFASGFGKDSSVMTATAVADYTGPAPMGSPCNTFGNEPAGTSLLGPVLSQLLAPVGASCSSTPQFWANAEGPNVYKTQGDRYGVRYCAGGEDGCTGTTNDEFDPAGYFYTVRVGAGAVGQSVTLQAYDPAYVGTQGRCTSAPSGTISSISNAFSSGADAASRYARTATTPAVGTPSAFCSGDDQNLNYRTDAANEVPTITSFALRAPTPLLQPKIATPVPGCTKQFRGWSTNQVTAAALTQGSGSYDQQLASVFHQWVPLCTFVPTAPGEYYLQVRTDVALGGTLDPATGIWSGNPAVTGQVGDDPAVTGNGANRFALRAVSSAGASVSIAGWQRMTLYTNSNVSAATFNLVRVTPSNAGKILDFSFFDAGDAATSGTIQVLPPTDSVTPMGTCTGLGKVTGTLVGCAISGINRTNGWDGVTQHIRVQLPAGYTCNEASAGGCWFRVSIGFGSGSVYDCTTWSARVEGDPVRLIE